MDHATDPALIRRLHERAIDAADLIFYSSRKLLAEATSGREKSHLLEQAVDFDHWARISNGELEGRDADCSRFRSPRIGYFGAIEPWLVDQELIKRAARERPDWQLDLHRQQVARTGDRSLAERAFSAACFLRGAAALRCRIRCLRAAVGNRGAFTSYGSAIKVREYLATGKPVVISPLPEYESMSDVLRIGRSRDQFLELVDDALREAGNRKSAARVRPQCVMAPGTRGLNGSAT